MIGSVLGGVLVAIMIVFLIVQSFQALLLAAAVPELWSHWQLSDDEYFLALLGGDALPPVSVVAVVRGMGDGAVALATALLALDYPRHEVVLVADSADPADERTFAALSVAFALRQVAPAFASTLRTAPVRRYCRSQFEPRLVVVDQTPASAADAMNAGLNAARYPHALLLGRRVQLERDALLRLTRPFLMSRNVVAVGTTLRPAGGAEPADGAARRLRGIQTVEHLRNFLLQRLGWNRLASNLIYPQATVLFRRDHVFAVGGFRDVEEPAIDLGVRLHRHLTDVGINARLPVIPDAAASAPLPERWSDIRVARQRWQRGLLGALSQVVPLIFDPGYGAFGFLALPYFWLAIIIAPVLELLGYPLLVIALATGAVSPGLAGAYLAAVLGYGMLLSVWTVVLAGLSARRPGHQGLARLFLYALLEPFGYRQRIAWYRATAYWAGDHLPSSHPRIHEQPTPAGSP